MKIFYIDINEFKKNYGKNILTEYADIKLNSEKRFFEYTLGRYLVREAAKVFYDVSDKIVLSTNGKPKFKNSNLQFSISHSKNIIMVCFDNHPCGIDIEYIKPRDFTKLAVRYKQEFATCDDFYKFWTLKEAAYKLGSKITDYKTFKFENHYCVTVVSAVEFENNPVAINYLAR